MTLTKRLLFLLGPILVFSQQKPTNKIALISTDFSVGFLGDSNADFPDHGLQQSLFLNFGKQYAATEKEWSYRLNQPKVGIAFGFSDLGNRDALGYTYSVLPYAEFSLLSSKTNRLNLWAGFGGSYMDRIYDPLSNTNNKAVSTGLNWSFRSFFYYDWLRLKNSSWRMGLGYFHHSNGHVRKPNRGYNSVLFAISGEFGNSELQPGYQDSDLEYAKSSDWFYTARLGIGQNSFSDVFNSKKEAYAGAFSFGKLINKTFKLGAGVYYRFYEHYYDYVVNQETLVRTQNPEFIDHPIRSASNFGVFGSAEVVLGHFGMELNLGVNIHKPFYKIDWQLNEGYTTFSNGEETIVLGELDTYYKIKQQVMGRMGLKYYVFDLEKPRKHNLFVGAFINSNLGQADFSELTVGYVHQLSL